MLKSGRGLSGQIRSRLRYRAWDMLYEEHPSRNSDKIWLACSAARGIPGAERGHNTLMTRAIPTGDPFGPSFIAFDVW